jgi:hypothetical protein
MQTYEEHWLPHPAPVAALVTFRITQWLTGHWTAEPCGMSYRLTGGGDTREEAIQHALRNCAWELRPRIR